jgi:hypothetical protein
MMDTELPDLAELLRRASLDAEPASLFVLGESEQDIDSAVLIVKGGANVRKLMECLTSAGLMSAAPVPPDRVRIN